LTTFTESVVKSAALDLAETFGCKIEHDFNIATGEQVYTHHVEAVL
jgi:hypothetical protein